MLFAQIKKTYRELPSSVKIFALRGSILLTGWLLLYSLLLKPLDIPDAQLTHITQVCTTRVLGTIYPGTHLIAPGIYLGNAKIINITNPCNGLELYVLYAGFLICIPSGNRKRFFAFAFAGIAVIFVLNILRCVGLSMLSIYKSTLFDIAHHYIFKLIIYAVAFSGWILYNKKDTVNDK